MFSFFNFKQKNSESQMKKLKSQKHGKAGNLSNINNSNLVLIICKTLITLSYDNNNQMNMVSADRIVMRSDRLPTSSNQQNYAGVSYCLQNNQNFSIYHF